MRKDLVILVPDIDIQSGLQGIMERNQALGIRGIPSVDFRRHVERDPGCLLRGHDFLRPFVNEYEHALVVLDRVGCGREGETREELEGGIEVRLQAAGWDRRAAAVVIDPEIEAWVWSDSPHVDEVLGWEGRRPALREWLVGRGLLTAPDQKPGDPKAAMVEALFEAGKAPRSASYYRELGRTVGLDRCTDPAFEKFRTTLRNWFPPR